MLEGTHQQCTEEIDVDTQKKNQRKLNNRVFATSRNSITNILQLNVMRLCCAREVRPCVRMMKLSRTGQQVSASAAERERPGGTRRFRES